MTRSQVAGHGRGLGDAILGLVVGAAAFALYARTASSCCGSEDVAEFQTLGATGGISHAGYPLLTLALQMANHLPIASPALRANLVAAACGAVAAGLLAWGSARATADRLAAFAASGALVLSCALWRDATRAEVYAFSLPLAAATFLLLRAWVHRPGAARAFALGLALGLALTAHLSVLALATVASGVVARRLARRSLGWAEFAAGAAGVLLGVSALLLLALQDTPNGPMNYLATSFDADAPFHVAWAPDAATHVKRIALLISGRQYLETGWFHPFRDTGLRLRGLGLHLVLDDLPLLGVPLAALGLGVALLRRSRTALLLAGWLVALLGWLAMAAFPDVVTSFFLPGLWALAWCAAIGVAWLGARSRPLAWAAAAALIALPLARLRMADPPASLASHPVAAAAWREWPGATPPWRPDCSWEAFARGALAALPPRAIVLTRWTEGTPLLYARHARSERTDVDVRLTGDQPGRIARALADAGDERREVWATFAPTHPAPGAWRPGGRWPRGALWRYAPAPPSRPEERGARFPVARGVGADTLGGQRPSRHSSPGDSPTRMHSIPSGNTIGAAAVPAVDSSSGVADNPGTRNPASAHAAGAGRAVSEPVLPSRERPIPR